MKGEGNVLSQAEEKNAVCVTGIANQFLPFVSVSIKPQTDAVLTTIPTPQEHTENPMLS